MEAVPPQPLPPGATYAHAAWPGVGDLVAATWGESDVAWERTIAGRLAWWIEQAEQGAPLPIREHPALVAVGAGEGCRATSPTSVTARPPAKSSDLDAALRIAALVQRDGDQRALEVDVDDPEDLEELRLELRDHLSSGLQVDGERLTHVRPWIWSAATSGGRPLTSCGEQTGYELRVSRYRAAQYD
jgi:hypothetical protein